MKNKYKVVALVPLEFSVEGSSDSKEAIESVKNIFEACRNDNDCADIVFDGIEESLGEFLTAIARDWFWNMDKPYKKCEELLLSCMMGGNEEEKRHVCQDIIEGRKRLVGVNEFELVDDNVHVRSLGQKV